ncbi:ABC transporter permease [Anaerosporobacter sp.]
MWIKKLKKKKLQFIVLGLILAFAAMLLSTCLSFSIEVEQYTDDRFSRENNSDLFLYATGGTSDYLRPLLKEHDTLATLTTNNGYFINTLPMYHKDTLVSDYITPLYALELDSYESMPFQMDIVSGNMNSFAPAPGEVWIQKIVADNHDIQVGDTFSDKETSYNFTVSAIVNDNTKPVSMSTGAFIYYNKADSKAFEDQQPLEFISITSEQDIDILSQWIENQYTHEHYAVLKSTLNDLKTRATIMTSLISKLGTLSSLFMFLITIIIVLFFIRNTILNEYGAIGTYKSVGFSTKEIMGFYLKAYSVVGIFSIIIGALLGLPVSIFIGNIVMEYMGTYRLSTASIPRVILVIIFTSILLLASIYLALRKIGKISPVDALHVGTTSTKAKLKKSLIKNAHSSLSMAINDMFKYRNRSLLVVIVVTFSFYIGIMLINMCVAFNHMEDNATAWVAQPKSNCFLSKDNSSIPDDLLNYVKNSPYVASYITGSGASYANLQVSCEDSSINVKYANITVLNTYDYDLTGIKYAKGRPPQNKNEVAIDSTTLNNSDYTIGDTISLTINDVTDNYLITGIFHSMMAPALSFVTEAFTEFPEENYNTSIGVNLKNPNDAKAFEKDFKNTFPDYRYSTMKDIVDNVKQSVMSIMTPVTMIIIGIFCSFTLLNIINLIIMNNHEQQKNFGIMKAFGFTNAYIIRRNVFRILILSITGTILALALNQFLNARIFLAILTVDAYQTKLVPTSIFIGTGLVVITIITILLSLEIRRISPKKLME